MALLDRLRVSDPEVRHWFIAVLRAKTEDEQAASRERAEECQRQWSLIRQQQDRLLHMRLTEEIDANTYASKAKEFRDRVAALELQLQACSRSGQETAALAIKTFELSQTLRDKWVAADSDAKRQILEIVGLNYASAT